MKRQKDISSGWNSLSENREARKFRECLGDRKQKNWEIWLRGWVHNGGNLGYHTKECEEQWSGGVHPRFYFYLLDISAKSLQQNTVVSVCSSTMNSDTRNILPPSTMETPRDPGEQFWQVKDQAGISSRAGIHSIFWPLVFKISKVFVLCFCWNTNFNPEF